MSIIDTTTNTTYATISDAITQSGNGDVIALSAGLYTEDLPIITHSLTIEGVGGLAHIASPTGTPSNGRAILYVGGNAGANLTVINLELSGAHDAASNGAGILFEVGNGNLTISNSWFHDNQDGVLVGSQAGSVVTIDHSEFNNNGLPSTDPRYGLAHNLYVNQVDSLTITDSYFHDALGGHEIKSRALNTVITDNRIQDQDGDTSYSIDLPNGGNATITGNVIEKGANAQNRYVIHYGGEFYNGPDSTPGTLTVTGNTFINDREGGATGIYNQTVANEAGQGLPVTITDNTFYNMDALYQDGTGPSIAPGDVIDGNVLATTAAPALDTSDPFAQVPEPASISLLLPLLLVAPVLRRRIGRRARS